MRLRRERRERRVAIVYRRRCPCGHSIIVSVEPIDWEPRLPCCDKERPTSIQARLRGEA